MRQPQARERIPALSVAVHRADHPLWTFRVGTSSGAESLLGPFGGRHLTGAVQVIPER